MAHRGVMRPIQLMKLKTFVGRCRQVLNSLPLIKDLPEDGVDPIRESDIAKVRFHGLLFSFAAFWCAMFEAEECGAENVVRLHPCATPGQRPELHSNAP
eukprot:1393350-Rhodomonas_salina.1